jgi:hypothetical protein
MADQPDGWPPEVQPMTLEGLKRLGTDAGNQLFWDGKRVRTRLTLSLPQTIVAILAALASLATIFTGLNNASFFLCARGVRLLGCPPGLAAAAPVPPHPPQAPP